MTTQRTLSFGGGCFWGVEHAFKQVSGVTKTEVGYQGGESTHTTYEEVCRKDTGHAEVVQVSFEEDRVSLTRLLDAFFFMHDPTQNNRQGPDIGSQYRSCVFVSTEEEKEEVENYIKTHSEALIAKGQDNQVTTEVAVNTNFIKAEDNHQDYLLNNPSGYCHIGFDVFQKLKMGEF